MHQIRKFHFLLYRRKFSLTTGQKILVKILGLDTGMLILAAVRLQR